MQTEELLEDMNKDDESGSCSSCKGIMVKETSRQMNKKKKGTKWACINENSCEEEENEEDEEDDGIDPNDMQDVRRAFLHLIL